MQLQTTLSVILIILYGIIFIVIVPFGVYMTWRESRNKLQLRAAIQTQVHQGLDVTADYVRKMAHGLGINRTAVPRVVNRILSDISDAATSKAVFALSQQLEKEEPFNELPEEVRPSLMRLVELCDSSGTKSDHLLLSPIQRSLNSYVELQAQVKRGRRMNMIINGVGVISLFVGLWGAYATLQSPTAGQIAMEVARTMQNCAASNADCPKPAK